LIPLLIIGGLAAYSAYRVIRAKYDWYTKEIPALMSVSGCKVHNGFYEAEKEVFGDSIND